VTVAVAQNSANSTGAGFFQFEFEVRKYHKIIALAGRPTMSSKNLCLIEDLINGENRYR